MKLHALCVLWVALLTLQVAKTDEETLPNPESMESDQVAEAFGEPMENTTNVHGAKSVTDKLENSSLVSTETIVRQDVELHSSGIDISSSPLLAYTPDVIAKMMAVEAIFTESQSNPQLCDLENQNATTDERGEYFQCDPKTNPIFGMCTTTRPNQTIADLTCSQRGYCCQVYFGDDHCDSGSGKLWPFHNTNGSLLRCATGEICPPNANNLSCSSSGYCCYTPSAPKETTGATTTSASTELLSTTVSFQSTDATRSTTTSPSTELLSTTVSLQPTGNPQLCDLENQVPAEIKQGEYFQCDPKTNPIFGMCTTTRPNETMADLYCSQRGYCCQVYFGGDHCDSGSGKPWPFHNPNGSLLRCAPGEICPPNPNNLSCSSRHYCCYNPPAPKVKPTPSTPTVSTELLSTTVSFQSTAKPILCEEGRPPVQRNGEYERCDPKISTSNGHCVTLQGTDLGDAKCNPDGYCCVVYHAFCDLQTKPVPFLFQNGSMLACKAQPDVCEYYSDKLSCSTFGYCCLSPWRPAGQPWQPIRLRASAALAMAISGFPLTAATEERSATFNGTLPRTISECFTKLFSYVEEHVTFHAAEKPPGALDQYHKSTMAAIQSLRSSIRSFTDSCAKKDILESCPVFKLSKTGTILAATETRFVESLLNYTYYSISDKGARMVPGARAKLESFCDPKEMFHVFSKSTIGEAEPSPGNATVVACEMCKNMHTRYNCIHYWEQLRVIASATCDRFSVASPDARGEPKRMEQMHKTPFVPLSDEERIALLESWLNVDVAVREIYQKNVGPLADACKFPRILA